MKEVEDTKFNIEKEINIENTELVIKMNVLNKENNNLQKEYEDINNRNVLLNYDSNDIETTEFFSLNADARIFWGGDLSVSMLKQIISKERAVDVIFSDRHSGSIIDVDTLSRATPKEFERLTHNLYNDIFLMDQNACSSPRVIFWKGGSNNAYTSCKDELLSSVLAIAKKKYPIEASQVISKFNNAKDPFTAYNKTAYLPQFWIGHYPGEDDNAKSGHFQTLEVLETYGVPVIAFGQDKMPAFWSSTSDTPAPLHTNSIDEIVSAVHARKALKLVGGHLIANPVPFQDQIPANVIEPIIEEALTEATAQEISAKLVTPFLLKRIFELTQGKSLTTNIALVKNNARLAAQISSAFFNADKY